MRLREDDDVDDVEDEHDDDVDDSGVCCGDGCCWCWCEWSGCVGGNGFIKVSSREMFWKACPSDNVGGDDNVGDNDVDKFDDVDNNTNAVDDVGTGGPDGGEGVGSGMGV